MVRINVDGELAHLLRPIPSSMATGDEPVIIGGLPRLPSDMDWPRQADGVPTHFFAQIDLSGLIRKLDGQCSPDFPNKGTLFVFFPLGDQGFHWHYTAQVLYTEKSTSKLPERSPPDGLYNVLEQDPNYMHPDGMTHEGTVILRRQIDVLPFFSPLPSRKNRDLRLSGNEEDWKRSLKEDQEHSRLHRKNMDAALRGARPVDPSFGEHLLKRQPVAVLPYRFRRREEKVPQRQRVFDIDTLDWRFVFGWAKFFYLRCLNRTQKEMRRAETNWLSKWFRSRVLRDLEGRKAEVERFEYHPDDDLAPGSSKLIPDASLAFDDQANKWLTLAMASKGPLPPDMKGAFIKMLIEIDRRADERGFKGKRLRASIAMLENHVRGSSVNASTTITYATDAFEHALPSEAPHVPQYEDGLSQVERWDLQLSQIYVSAMASRDFAHAVLGATPLQIFGRGDAVQTAVDDHIGDVLLMQIGEATGLPLAIESDMVLHLWIKPEDLASGCFDRVETTIEMT